MANGHAPISDTVNPATIQSAPGQAGAPAAIDDQIDDQIDPKSIIRAPSEMLAGGAPGGTVGAMRGVTSDIAAAGTAGVAGAAQGAALGAVKGATGAWGDSAAAALSGLPALGSAASWMGNTIRSVLQSGMSKYIPENYKQEFSQAIDHATNYIGSLVSGLGQAQPATVARNAPPGEAPPKAARLANVPGEFRQMILDAAEEFHLDPLMLAAVMTKESGGTKFNPQAKGTSGERGLMQIMPNTWRGLTKSIENPQGADFNQAFDPETNIRMGAKLLSQLMQHYDDDESDALFHYNASKNITAGEAYAQDVLRIMGKLGHDENVSAKGGTVTPVKPAAPQAAAAPAGPEQFGTRDLEKGRSQEVEGPLAAPGPGSAEKPKAPEMEKQMLIGGEPPRPLTTQVLESVEDAARSLAADPWTLLKAAAQGVSHANPLYQKLSGKEWPLGRTAPEKILEAGGRVGAGMLIGGEGEPAAAAEEAPAERPAAEPRVEAPQEVARRGPETPEAPVAESKIKDLSLQQILDTASERIALGEIEPGVEGTPRMAAEEAPRKAARPTAARRQLEKQLSEILERLKAEGGGEAEEEAPPEEDLTGALTRSLKKPKGKK